MASPSKQSKLPLNIQAFVRKAEEQLDSLLANSAAFRSDRPETVLFLTEVQQLVEACGSVQWQTLGVRKAAQLSSAVTDWACLLAAGNVAAAGDGEPLCVAERTADELVATLKEAIKEVGAMAEKSRVFVLVEHNLAVARAVVKLSKKGIGGKALLDALLEYKKPQDVLAQLGKLGFKWIKRKYMGHWLHHALHARALVEQYRRAPNGDRKEQLVLLLEEVAEELVQKKKLVSHDWRACTAVFLAAFRMAQLELQSETLDVERVQRLAAVVESGAAFKNFRLMNNWRARTVVALASIELLRAAHEASQTRPGERDTWKEVLHSVRVTLMAQAALDDDKLPGSTYSRAINEGSRVWDMDKRQARDVLASALEEVGDDDGGAGDDDGGAGSAAGLACDDSDLEEQFEEFSEMLDELDSDVAFVAGRVEKKAKKETVKLPAGKVERLVDVLSLVGGDVVSVGMDAQRVLCREARAAAGADEPSGDGADGDIDSDEAWEKLLETENFARGRAVLDTLQTLTEATDAGSDKVVLPTDVARKAVELVREEMAHRTARLKCVQEGPTPDGGAAAGAEDASPSELRKWIKDMYAKVGEAVSAGIDLADLPSSAAPKGELVVAAMRASDGGTIKADTFDADVDSESAQAAMSAAAGGRANVVVGGMSSTGNGSSIQVGSFRSSVGGKKKKNKG